MQSLFIFHFSLIGKPNSWSLSKDQPGYTEFLKSVRKFWRRSMRRRAHLKALVMAALGLRLSNAQVKTGAARPIQLFVEMEVDPKNEKDMLNNFHSIFVPEAKKHA